MSILVLDDAFHQDIVRGGDGAARAPAVVRGNAKLHRRHIARAIEQTTPSGAASLTGLAPAGSAHVIPIGLRNNSCQVAGIQDRRWPSTAQKVRADRRRRRIS